MSSSEASKTEPQEIAEYQWPGLEQPGEVTVLTPYEFHPLDLSLWDENSPEAQALKAKAEEILAAARQKAQELERQAYEEGFRQGQQDGQEMGKRGLEEVTRHLNHLVIALEEEREKLFRTWEKFLVELAVAVGEKLAARELSLHPEAIRQIVEAGFAQISGRENIKVVVSPSDYEILRQENLSSWPPGVELAADGTLTPGECRLLTSLGEVDGTWESRRALLSQAVKEALETLEVPPENL